MLKFSKKLFLFFKEGNFLMKENGESFGIFLIFNMESSDKSETRRFPQILQFFENFVFNRDFGHYYECLIITKRLWTT